MVLTTRGACDAEPASGEGPPALAAPVSELLAEVHPVSRNVPATTTAIPALRLFIS